MFILVFISITSVSTLLAYLIFRNIMVSVFGFIVGFIFFVAFLMIGSVYGEEELPDMEKVPTSFEMELVSGNIICRTFSLPSTLTKYYIETNRGSYIAFYDREVSTFWGYSTRERYRTLKNGVIDIKKVDSCSGFSEK